MTGVVLDTLTFCKFLERVFQNPLWNESWKHGQAQLAISQLAQQAEEKSEESFVVSEEDWAFLEKATKFPQTAMASGHTIPGFGYIPSIARQIVPLQLAVIEAVRI